MHLQPGWRIILQTNCISQKFPPYIPDFLHNSEQTKAHILHLQSKEIILILHSDVSTDTGACYLLPGPSSSL